MNSKLSPCIWTLISLPLALVLATSLTAVQALAQTDKRVEIDRSGKRIEIFQSRGADQSLRYTDLLKLGPWDDRNYRLTAAELKLLAPNEAELKPGIPAFFRVELRRAWPHLMRTGPAQYPRAALQLFYIRYGGLKQNGVIKNDRREQARAAERVTVNDEVQLNQVLGANEVTVEINPSNPQQVIAGANNNGGQEMYYSTDGGSNWTIQGVLPNTCCDPTIDWSSDGSVAYAAALSGSIGVSAWRSFDGGQSWVDRVNLTNSGSDKEFIHVDKSPSSSHKDNVYLTYHNGNTMQFARSTDMGATYSIQAFDAAPKGIGSDITTDPAGNIYYFYGAFNSKQIIMLKSVDGGLTFGSPFAVASTNGSFDFPIPSIESRRAWIYTATDADRSGGAFDGSIYVSWTDTIGPESGNPSSNHTTINVAYSRDGGATWNQSTPHPTADQLTVDRWNQWLTVDEYGTVHVVYYDTRNSANRTGVDLYYSYSTDGGVTWNTAERISSETSANLTDGQEFGDYNGISVVGAKGIPAWTDNRDGPPNRKDVFAADIDNPAAQPGFALSGDALNQQVCTPGNLADITVSAESIESFSNDVTLAYSGLPAGSSGAFSVNPVAPGNTSLAQVFIGPVATGDYTFDITGSAADAPDKSLVVGVAAFDAAPLETTPLTPANGASGTSTSPTLSWSPVDGAQSYVLEIDDDDDFSSIDISVNTPDTSASPGTALGLATTYYWRVRAVNPCGNGADSPVFSFTTGVQFCRSDIGDIPDNGATTDTLVLAESGELIDLRVSLRATHTYVGDLAFTLVHEETGTSVGLIDRPGMPPGTYGCSGDDIDVLLDDEAASPVETACAGFSPSIGGTLSPNGSLTAFEGEDLSGTWRLDISDNVATDTGTLDEWCLLPSLAASGTDTDEDGIADKDDNCTLMPNADQRDTNGDGFGNICDTDLNNDGITNAIDLGRLRSVFFSADPDADFNGDGVVNFGDLGVMKSLFFQPRGPAVWHLDLKNSP